MYKHRKISLLGSIISRPADCTIVVHIRGMIQNSIFIHTWLNAYIACSASTTDTCKWFKWDGAWVAISLMRCCLEDMLLRSNATPTSSADNAPGTSWRKRQKDRLDVLGRYGKIECLHMCLWEAAFYFYSRLKIHVLYWEHNNIKYALTGIFKRIHSQPKSWPDSINKDTFFFTSLCCIYHVHYVTRQPCIVVYKSKLYSVHSDFWSSTWTCDMCLLLYFLACRHYLPVCWQW